LRIQGFSSNRIVSALLILLIAGCANRPGPAVFRSVDIEQSIAIELRNSDEEPVFSIAGTENVGVGSKQGVEWTNHRHIEAFSCCQVGNEVRTALCCNSQIVTHGACFGWFQVSQPCINSFD
jgi:hypothetical protein